MKIRVDLKEKIHLLFVLVREVRGKFIESPY
jgi:hypothetical protein